jgi:ubiquinone/menaquinone biosynthesis C-methylase UbiE
LTAQLIGVNITINTSEARMTLAPQPFAPDKSRLVNEAYATDEPLLVRIETHRRYSVPAIDLPAWALDRRPWRSDETVLDIGAGSGQYLAPLRERVPRGRIIAGDLAPGMLRDLRAKGAPGDAMLLNADAEALPLADGSCDVILASYVMFFIPDIPRAVSEIHRVLRPGGALLAVTSNRRSCSRRSSRCWPTSLRCAMPSAITCRLVARGTILSPRCATWFKPRLPRTASFASRKMQGRW